MSEEKSHLLEEAGAKNENDREKGSLNSTVDLKTLKGMHLDIIQIKQPWTKEMQ